MYYHIYLFNFVFLTRRIKRKRAMRIITISIYATYIKIIMDQVTLFFAEHPYDVSLVNNLSLE
jgi:hypothetical protein